MKCPLCDAELLSELRVWHVNGALAQGRPIRLYAACHDTWWDANEVETEQIRSYLEIVWREVRNA